MILDSRFPQNASLTTEETTLASKRLAEYIQAKLNIKVGYDQFGIRHFGVRSYLNENTFTTPFSMDFKVREVIKEFNTLNNDF